MFAYLCHTLLGFKRETLVTEGKTLVTRGKTLVTKGKTLESEDKMVITGKNERMIS